MTDDPTRHLTPPEPEQATLQNGFGDLTYLLDYFSPSAWLFTIVKEVSGVDILDEVLAPLVGHWDKLSAYGDALNKLSLCLDETGTNVRNTTNALRPRWEGNAADAAYAYFDAAAGSLTAHAALLATAQAEYRDVAREMWTICESMKDIIEAILDDALIIAIYEAAGTLTAETGVGAVIGNGLATLQIIELVKKLHRAFVILRTAKAVIDSFDSAAKIFSQKALDIREIAPIKGVYDHPMVR
jgi:hypothetical protein